jgi:hypothetical protein
VVLLEVMAATTILAVAGLGIVRLVDAESRSLAEAQQREAELADEDRLLTAHVLLSRSDLELRLGVSVVGPYLVGIQRPTRTLFRIALRRAANPQRDDLVTVVYREDLDAR